VRARRLRTNIRKLKPKIENRQSKVLLKRSYAECTSTLEEREWSDIELGVVGLDPEQRFSA
jgi:hypothetical protein